jgi:hypothetical protein
MVVVVVVVVVVIAYTVRSNNIPLKFSGSIRIVLS